MKMENSVYERERPVRGLTSRPSGDNVSLGIGSLTSHKTLSNRIP
jgi:hypothetical protein